MWQAIDEALRARGCTVKWSNGSRICFVVPEGSIRWAYNGIELTVVGLGAEGSATLSRVRHEAATAERLIAEVRESGAVVVPEPPPAPKPVPVAKPHADGCQCHTCWNASFDTKANQWDD